MSWSDYFPILSDEMVQEYQASAPASDRKFIEGLFEVRKLLNRNGEFCDSMRRIPPLKKHSSKQLISLSLYNYPESYSDLSPNEPSIVLEQTVRPASTSPCSVNWRSRIATLIFNVPRIRLEYPDSIFRVYLAADLAFLADDLVRVGCEVCLMKEASAETVPGALWPFLALQEEDWFVTILTLEEFEILGKYIRISDSCIAAGLGYWRYPDNSLCPGGGYRPIGRGTMGAYGGSEDISLILNAAMWWSMNKSRRIRFFAETIDPEGLLEQWTEEELNQLMLTAALHPRLAMLGCMSMVTSWISHRHLALDAEYVTWANSASEVHLL